MNSRNCLFFNKQWKGNTITGESHSALTKLTLKLWYNTPMRSRCHCSFRQHQEMSKPMSSKKAKRDFSEMQKRLTMIWRKSWQSLKRKRKKKSHLSMSTTNKYKGAWRNSKTTRVIGKLRTGKDFLRDSKPTLLKGPKLNTTLVFRNQRKWRMSFQK